MYPMESKYYFDLIHQSTSIYKIPEQVLILQAEILPCPFLLEHVFLFHFPFRIDLNVLCDYIYVCVCIVLVIYVILSHLWITFHTYRQPKFLCKLNFKIKNFL